MEIKFPMTTAEFIAYQEAGIHRSLDEEERKLAALSVEAFNLVYTRGRRGLNNIGTTVDEYVAMGTFQPPETAEYLRFLQAVVHWSNEAYRQGRRDAGTQGRR